MSKITDRFKKTNAEDDGFDIVTDIKEPFSFRNFFEVQVIERVKRIKATLAEKGILFFLTSPFQARSRLVAQISILCIGVLFGVVPRASNMVTEMQDKAYVSEIEKLKEQTVGSITLTPAASSHYKRIHMLAFVVEGDSLPSMASGYEVHLASSYGASDWSDVGYSWNVVPVDDKKRIMLVAIDQTKQASGYGAFDLFIQLAGEELEDYEKEPFEVVISTAQETKGLYDKNGIHLSALTEAVCGTGQISAKQEEFEKELEEYQVVVEQTEAMPVDISVSPTAEELEATCLTNRLYRSLTDTSTTGDIVNLIQETKVPEFMMDTVLTLNGITYDDKFIKEVGGSETMSDDENVALNAFNTVDGAKNSVIGAMNNVNSAALNWYTTLKNSILVLNQEMTLDRFPYSAQCTAVITDDIKYVKDRKEDGNETSVSTEPAVSGKPEEEAEEEADPEETPEVSQAPEETDYPQ